MTDPYTLAACILFGLAVLAAEAVRRRRGFR